MQSLTCVHSQEKVAVHDTQISDLREAEKEAQETLASKQPRLEELKELIKAERSRASAFKVCDCGPVCRVTS